MRESSRDRTSSVSGPTAGVTRKWVGVDSVWKQKKLEAWKLPVNRADSHLSGARFVRRFVLLQIDCLEKIRRLS